VNKLTFRFHEPERGDVIVFKEPTGDPCAREGVGIVLPEECNRTPVRKAVDWFAELFGVPTGDIANKDYIKRIVALPGDTFEMREGVVYIDGERTDFESRPNEYGPQLDNTEWTPVKVPDDHLFVLGDNRGNSSDSRVFGPVGRDKVIGKAFVIVWPPTRFSGL
jgi:signal peptidase I